MDLKILSEDKHVLCLEKPAGMPIQNDKTDDKDLMSYTIDYLKSKNQRDYIGLIHRLDRPVGGVVCFAKNENANKNLSRQIQERKIDKEYICVVCNKPKSDNGELEDYIKKLRTINMSKITNKDDKQAKIAKLSYKVLDVINSEEYGLMCLVLVKLLTGRHHQIRIQLSNAGFPIWGDNKYNKVFVKKKDWTQIALWSYKFGFKHPNTNEYIEVKDKPENIYPFSLFNMDIL